jgi:hypothetical protein
VKREDIKQGDYVKYFSVIAKVKCWEIINKKLLIICEYAITTRKNAKFHPVWEIGPQYDDYVENHIKKATKEEIMYLESKKSGSINQDDYEKQCIDYLKSKDYQKRKK